MGMGMGWKHGRRMDNFGLTFILVYLPVDSMDG